jgi:hypothetical protein
MHDVNPLGPMMHLKEIERDALAFHRARMESRSRVLAIAREPVVKVMKRLRTSLRSMAAGDRANKVAETNPADRLPSAP